jgi:hypothetical protein
VVNDGVNGHSTDDGPGKAEITGQTLSVTEMVWEAVQELPQSSVAVQVRVVLYSWSQTPGVVTSLNVNDGLGSQASVAVGVANDGVAGHSTDDGPGKAEITGQTLSVTEMVWEAVQALPQSSVAVQVRVVLYSWSQTPGVVTSANVGVTLGSQASVAVGVVKLGVAGHSIDDGPGKAESTGQMVSSTVIVCSQVVCVPAASVNVQVLVIMVGQVPETTSLIVVSVGGQLAVTVGEPVLDVSLLSVHSIVTSSGPTQLIWHSLLPKFILA